MGRLASAIGCACTLALAGAGSAAAAPPTRADMVHVAQEFLEARVEAGTTTSYRIRHCHPPRRDVRGRCMVTEYGTKVAGVEFEQLRFTIYIDLRHTDRSRRRCALIGWVLADIGKPWDARVPRPCR